MSRIVGYDVSEAAEETAVETEPEGTERVPIVFADLSICGTCRFWTQGMAYHGGRRAPVMLCGRHTVSPPPTPPFGNCRFYEHNTARIA